MPDHEAVPADGGIGGEVAEFLFRSAGRFPDPVQAAFRQIARIGKPALRRVTQFPVKGEPVVGVAAEVAGHVEHPGGPVFAFRLGQGGEPGPRLRNPAVAAAVEFRESGGVQIKLPEARRDGGDLILRRTFPAPAGGVECEVAFPGGVQFRRGESRSGGEEIRPGRLRRGQALLDGKLPVPLLRVEMATEQFQCVGPLVVRPSRRIGCQIGNREKRGAGKEGGRNEEQKQRQAGLHGRISLILGRLVSSTKKVAARTGTPQPSNGTARRAGRMANARSADSF